MTNELALGAPQLPGLLPDDAANRIIAEAVMFKPDGGGSFELRRALSNAEKATLQTRHRALRATLRPLGQAMAEKKRLGEALVAMFLGFPALRNTDAGAMCTAYVLALEDMPIFAALRACEDVTKRRVKGTDPDFPPTAPRLYEVAKRYMVEVAGEQVAIEKTLNGTVVAREKLTPEERERVIQKAKKLADELRARNEADRSPHREESMRRVLAHGDRAILAEYEQLGIEPIYADDARTLLLSPALAKVKIAAEIKDRRRRK